MGILGTRGREGPAGGCMGLGVRRTREGAADVRNNKRQQKHEQEPFGQCPVVVNGNLALPSNYCGLPSPARGVAGLYF